MPVVPPARLFPSLRPTSTTTSFGAGKLRRWCSVSDARNIDKAWPARGSKDIVLQAIKGHGVQFAGTYLPAACRR